MLSAPALAKYPELFPNKVLFSIRRAHPKLAANTIAVTCIGPTEVSYFQSGAQTQPSRGTVRMTWRDWRCDRPFTHLQDEIQPKRRR